MKKQVYEVDEKGYIKEIHVIGNTEDTVHVAVNPPQGLYRARWTGAAWVEDMSQEEINALNNQPQPPAEIELLKEKVAMQDMVIEELMFSIIPELTGGGM